MSGRKTDEKGAGAQPVNEKAKVKPQPKEIGGRAGPEPTRYGDWEKNGIISDF
ncbi:DUF1674 domain-containing protein [Kordiimonas aestuarii]|uniref:DUF1674 domain-containing protein n=1 Tax=Kordiimonas aestuarii TaxID=1005925 RepID=UPI0021D3E95D|nr:succinate dehydrogenase assembly factor 4 [Kordiimonas aestuarii]